MTKYRLIAIICALFILGLVAFAYWFLTEHSFSAREKPMWMEALLAKHVRKLALPPGTTAIKNPLIVTPLLIAKARDHFADHCATCHGNSGDGKTLIGEGLYPPTPDLRAQGTQELSDGELFYIIKNGIRFTGMPGFGGNDDENWRLVAFIRHMTNLSPNEIKLMRDLNGD